MIMKTRIFSGIESDHLIRSAIYFVAAIAMIASSFPAGVLKGNSFGVILFNIGLMLIFYALLRPWGNAKYYFIQFAALFVIFLVVQFAGIILKFKLTEDIMWLAGGIVIDAFIGSMTGVIVFSHGLKSFLYSASNVAVLAIFIMFPQTLSPDPALRYSTLITAYIFLIFQFASVFTFLLIASFAEKWSSYSKIVILISGIILILMGVWGIMAFEIKEWMFGIRIWSILDIVSGVLAIFAFALAYFNEDH